MDWLDLLTVKGTLKSLLQHHSSKASILWHSVFFVVRLSHLYLTTRKTIGSFGYHCNRNQLHLSHCFRDNVYRYRVLCCASWLVLLDLSTKVYSAWAQRSQNWEGGTHMCSLPTLPLWYLSESYFFFFFLTRMNVHPHIIITESSSLPYGSLSVLSILWVCYVNIMYLKFHISIIIIPHIIWWFSG